MKSKLTDIDRKKELDEEIAFLEDYIKRMSKDCDCSTSADTAYLNKLKNERKRYETN